MSSDDHMKERVKQSSHSHFRPSPKKLLRSEAPLGIGCSLVICSFGRSGVDVAAENHDRGRFVNESLFQQSHLMTLHCTQDALKAHYP